MLDTNDHFEGAIATRLVDGTDVAYRPQSARPGEYWVDWLAGDWSYYVIASGFPDDHTFFAALSSLTLTDAATFEAIGADINVVMPGQHLQLANQVLSRVDHSQAGLSTDVEATIAAAAGTGFERAANFLAVSLLQAMNGDVPSTLNNYTTDCPGWAIGFG